MFIFNSIHATSYTIAHHPYFPRLSDRIVHARDNRECIKQYTYVDNLYHARCIPICIQYITVAAIR